MDTGIGNNGSKLAASEENEIICSQCGTKYKIHSPRIMQLKSGEVFEMIMFSAHGLAERNCPKCDATHAPVVKSFDVVWAYFPKRNEVPRIAVPTMDQVKKIVG